MDAVRAIAMLLGIVLHSSIAYKLTSRPSWPTDDVIHSVYYNYLYSFIHSFRMQLFFLVAGFFARFLYMRIGEKAFIRHRLKRIALPFAAALIFIAPLSMLPFSYYHYWLGHPHQSFIQIMQAISPSLLRWNGMAHLWFLYYLIILYIVMLAAIWLDHATGIVRKVESWVYRRILIFPGKFTLPLLALPVFFISCLFRELPIKSYTGFKPDLFLMSYYAFFFFLGHVIHHYYASRLEVFKKNALLYVLIGIFMTPLIDYFYRIQFEEYSLGLFIITRGLFTFQTILLVFGFLGLSIRFLSSENYVLRYVSDASYWMYLIHFPLIAGTQLWLIGSPVPPFLRFWIVNMVGMIIPLATYAWFVRYTFIGRILNGPRTKRKRTTVQSGNPSYALFPEAKEDILLQRKMQ